MAMGKLILCSNTRKLKLWSKYDQVIVLDHPGARHLWRYEFSRIKVPFNIQKTKSYESLLDLAKISKKSCIFIPGGNTFDLINSLDIEILKSIILKALSNGIDVVCESAGAIICGSDIRSAIIPAEGADSNDCGTRKLKTMSLIDLVVFPHYLEKNNKQIGLFLIENKKLGLLIKENELISFNLKELKK